MKNNCKKCGKRTELITGIRMDYELCRDCQAGVNSHILELVQRNLNKIQR